MTLAEGIQERRRGGRRADGAVSDGAAASELLIRPSRRRFFSFKHSPLTRKIILFNLVALTVVIGGLLYVSPSDDGWASLRRQNLIAEAELVADVFEARLVKPDADAINQGDIEPILRRLSRRHGAEVYVFNQAGTLIAERVATVGMVPEDSVERPVISELLSRLGKSVSWILALVQEDEAPSISTVDRTRMIAGQILATDATATSDVEMILSADGGKRFIVVAPILRHGLGIGAVGLVRTEIEITALERAERERMYRMFIIATLVSIGLSLLLASTIATPLTDLADAAELGRERNRRNATTGRIRIPDLTARPDEIGRLSGALRGMVSALYDRIDSNEQFAADVSHEIKNPLASLRSAVGTMRVAKRADQQEKLLDVIEHDVRRLDRLVSDISNASRLDSELVKEEEIQFNLLETLGTLAEFLGEDARQRGIEFVVDLPDAPIHLHGLEARLAQVFVNLITNAISFCEDGDAIRIWARQRENRVLVVVEDTGPGIPEQALTQIFKRFYSQRPDGDFGNNSGLGLAISKQIVEAHDGVIWAENIRPTEADITSEPSGARFVVGLPV
ncbi:ATP-binding protein [Primorskyibacter flagellatus]|uniref:ATP-binding protein n=1 Tax=Primorskyibacter flagellatus TaxID=1387277 RepID=UPI003A93CD09